MRSRVYGVAAALLLMAVNAQAGQIQGRVSLIVQRASDGLTYVEIYGTATGRAGCAAQTFYWMIADENSEAGKKQFAMLLLAKASGLQVSLNGWNSCTRWGDGEDIKEVILLD